MRLRSLLAPLAVAAIALSACGTTDSRIRRQQALFDGYPPEVQENIRNGVIDVGYSPQMVVMALGEPDHKVEIQREDGVAEVWTYRRSVPGFAIGVGGGRYVGSRVGIGTGVTVGEPARSEDRAVIEFRGGRVFSFEALAPK